MKDEKQVQQGRQLLSTWQSSLKNMGLYGETHPTSKESVRRMNVALSDILQTKMEVEVNSVDGLFAMENVFYIEESLIFYELLSKLEAWKIQSVVFIQGIREDEFAPFLSFLMKKPTPETQHMVFQSANIRIMRETESDKNVISASRNQRFQDTYKIYSDWLAFADKIFSKLLEEQTFSMSEISTPLETLIDAIEREPAVFAMTLSQPQEGNNNVKHALHTMIITLFLARQLGFNMANLKSIAIAALLHDIGRFLLPSTFTTNTPLTESDVQLVQKHCLEGAAFLSSVPGLPVSVLRACLEHHLGNDRQGYPNLAPTYEPLFSSQIIGLADFVSWGTLSDSVYHRPAPLYRLMRSLIRRAGSQFDPFLVKLMLPFFGLYPTGTMVRLPGGTPGIVLEPNRRNISRPSVILGGPNNTRLVKWLGDTTTDTSSFQSHIDKVAGATKEIPSWMDYIADLQTNPLT